MVSSLENYKVLQKIPISRKSCLHKKCRSQRGNRVQNKLLQSKTQLVRVCFNNFDKIYHCSWVIEEISEKGGVCAYTKTFCHGVNKKPISIGSVSARVTGVFRTPWDI